MFGINRLTRLAEQIAAQLDAVRTELKQLPDKARFDALESKIDTIMATMQDLDDALTAFETAADTADQADAAAEAEIQSAVNDILSRVGPAVDVSAEVARIQAAQQKRATASAALKTAADNIQGLDVTPTPTPAPTP